MSATGIDDGDYSLPQMVAGRPTHIRHAGLDPASRFSMRQIKKRDPGSRPGWRWWWGLLLVVPGPLNSTRCLPCG